MPRLSYEATWVAGIRTAVVVAHPAVATVHSAIAAASAS